MYLTKDTIFFSEFLLRPASVPSRQVSDSLCSLQNTPQTHLQHGTPHAHGVLETSNTMNKNYPLIRSTTMYDIHIYCSFWPVHVPENTRQGHIRGG